MAAPGHPTGAVILVAAGSGERLGADVPKAFVAVGGPTMLEHAAARFRSASITNAIVVAPLDYVDAAGRLTGLPAVAGGSTRQESVAAGLAALARLGERSGDGTGDGTGNGRGNEIEFVLVHDVARPFVPASVISAVLAALAAGADAVVPVVALHDSIRSIARDGTLGGLVDRSSLVAIQTPQGFRRTVLIDAHERGVGAAATDDAGLVEAVGGRVVSVPGAEESFKITTPADLTRAQALATTLAAPTSSSTTGSS